MARFPPMSDDEIVWVCDNKSVVGEGICQGLVLLWMFGCFSPHREQLEQLWFRQLTLPAGDDSDSEDETPEQDLQTYQIDESAERITRPYVIAACLQTIYGKAGLGIFATATTVAQANMRVVEVMYSKGGLRAMRITKEYVPVAGGASLLLTLALRRDRYSHYHISLKTSVNGGGHAIAIARDANGDVYLFDPNMGMFYFATFSRFRVVIEKMFAPFRAHPYRPMGDYNKYGVMCIWGITQ